MQNVDLRGFLRRFALILYPRLSAFISAPICGELSGLKYPDFSQSLYISPSVFRWSYLGSKSSSIKQFYRDFWFYVNPYVTSGAIADNADVGKITQVSDKRQKARNTDDEP